MKFTAPEVKQVEEALRRILQSPKLSIRLQGDTNAELLAGHETVGTVYKDNEDGEVTYSINMTLLQDDLER